jgi:hypothetical protein
VRVGIDVGQGDAEGGGALGGRELFHFGESRPNFQITKLRGKGREFNRNSWRSSNGIFEGRRAKWKFAGAPEAFPSTT